MKYSTYKRKQKIIKKVSDVVLFPLRCIITPIDLLCGYYDKHKKIKTYSEAQIQEVVKYLIDYWVDYEKEFYIIADDDYNPFDFSNVKNAFHLTDLSWEKHRKVKLKAFHIYTHQKDEYIKTIIELCDRYGTKMTSDDKRREFKPWGFNGIKDRCIYKFTKNSN